MMKKLGMVVVILAMLMVAIVPALAQDGEFDVVPAEGPTATCATGPSSHPPGEFVVYYYSEEEMWAAPQENVVYTRVYDFTPIYIYYMQELYFEDIANIPDPCEMFAAQEAKRQEILAWPGVKIAGNAYASYNFPVPAAG